MFQMTFELCFLVLKEDGWQMNIQLKSDSYIIIILCTSAPLLKKNEWLVF